MKKAITGVVLYGMVSLPLSAQTHEQVAEVAVEAMRDRAKQCFIFTRTTGLVLRAKENGISLQEVMSDLGPSAEEGMVEAARVAYQVSSLTDDRVMEMHFECLEKAKNRILR